MLLRRRLPSDDDETCTVVRTSAVGDGKQQRWYDTYVPSFSLLRLIVVVSIARPLSSFNRAHHDQVSSQFLHAANGNTASLYTSQKSPNRLFGDS